MVEFDFFNSQIERIFILVGAMTPALSQSPQGFYEGHTGVMTKFAGMTKWHNHCLEAVYEFAIICNYNKNSIVTIMKI